MSDRKRKSTVILGADGIFRQQSPSAVGEETEPQIGQCMRSDVTGRETCYRTADDLWDLLVDHFRALGRVAMAQEIFQHYTDQARPPKMLNRVTNVRAS